MFEMFEFVSKMFKVSVRQEPRDTTDHCRKRCGSEEHCLRRHQCICMSPLDGKHCLKHAKTACCFQFVFLDLIQHQPVTARPECSWHSHVVLGRQLCLWCHLGRKPKAHRPRGFAQQDASDAPLVESRLSFIYSI